MKKPSLLLSLLCLAAPAWSQFALEHAYPNAGTPTSFNQLVLVELEDLGQRYVFFDRTALTLQFFDLDHQLVQTIDLSGAPDTGGGEAGSRHVLYITQYLFDLDPGIEVMYVTSGGAAPVSVTTSIVDESGAVIQSFPSEAPNVHTYVPQVQLPIYETPNGAKMVLSNNVTNEAKVYGLPGNLTTGMITQGDDISLPGGVHLFPNPATSEFVVTMDPRAVSDDQLLRLYAQDGRLVLEQRIAGSTTHVPSNGLAQGMYTYTIWRNGQPWYAGKVTIQ